MDRRLEYDKGPALEDDEPPDDPDDESRPPIGLEGVPWKVGPLAGAGAFAAVYAVAFQLVSAVYGFSPPNADVEIERRTVAGLVTLGSHGATVAHAEVSWFRYGLEVLLLFAPLFVALTALVVLVATGYAATRYVGPDSLRETVATAASVVPGYFLAAVLTARLATYEPETPRDTPAGPEEGVETLAVSVDSSFVLAFVLVPLTAALVGALVANRSLLCGSDGEARPADEGAAPTDAEGASASPPGRETGRR